MSKIEFFITEDGSPTAYFNGDVSSNFQQEKMHHSGGAFGESVYIYGPAIQWGFACVENPTILSLGTGLAYNEILSAAFSIVFDSPLKMASYEANDEINKALIEWLIGTDSKKIVPFSIYDSILKITSDLFDIPAKKIKSQMIKSFESGEWKICGAWNFAEEHKEKYNVILYDFFSSKAMETFWSEEFLTKFLKDNAHPQCAFATYACTGNLKRAFGANNFRHFERKGYLWKRSSTFGKRADF